MNDKTVKQETPPTNSNKPVPSRETPNELRAREVRETMKSAGRIRDTKTREIIAKNLGRIIQTRKENLNYSELVVEAGLSSNQDAGRLSRFRILPDKEVPPKTIKNLHQNPMSYLNIVDEIAKKTGEDPLILTLDLVIGTKFDAVNLSQVSIQPLEQLLANIQKKIDVLDAKYDLTGYFRTLREKELLPVWKDGVKMFNRMTPHHAYSPSELVGWAEKRNLSFGDEETNEWMPCVPLGRQLNNINDTAEYTIGANIQIGEEKSAAGFIAQYERIYLGIGMRIRRDPSEGIVPPNPSNSRLIFVGDGEKLNAMVESIDETRPLCPYIILAKEFHGHTGFYQMLNEDDLEYFTVTGFFHSGNGEGNCYGYDSDKGIDIDIIHEFVKYFPADNSSSIGTGMDPDRVEVYPLDLHLFRNLFDSQTSFWFPESDFDDEGPNVKSYRSESGDLLPEIETQIPTLSSSGTLAALLETNILGHDIPSENPEQMPLKTVLDHLEDDVKLRIQSLSGWISETNSKLQEKHTDLIEKLDKELEDAKANPKMNFDQGASSGKQ